MQGKGGEIMERLTMFSAIGGYQEYDPIDIVENDYSIANFKKLVEKLGEYEDLEEQGLLLRLPCRVGDTVWDIKWWDDVQEKKIIDGVSYYRWRQKHKVTKSKFSLYDYDYFGKTVFFTKEEAKARLKELERK